MQDNLEVLNAHKAEDVGEATTLSEAVLALLDFIDWEVDLPKAKKAAMHALQAQVRSFLPRADKTVRRTGKASRSQKRVVQVTCLESDEEEASDDVSEF